MDGSEGIGRRDLLKAGAVASVAAVAPPAQAAAPGAKLEAAEVAEIVKEWPQVSRDAVAATLRSYGPPQEATATMLVWRGNGPWKRTIVHRDAVDHAFPAPHKDVLEQVVEYKVPLNFFNALAVYNGSVVADRTRGELTAHCDSEAANFLSLNFAHDILRGKITAEQAREEHAQAARELASGGTPDYAKKLLIEAPQGDLSDPDTPAVSTRATTPK
jgi:hypothetical protein